MAGEQNLDKLIKEMTPELNSGKYAFVTTKHPSLVARTDAIAEFKEKEGSTLIISTKKADDLGLKYDFIAAWITLKVHSSLHAVGLTAAVSGALAAQGISCNIVAGYYHDHIFVAFSTADKAMEVLTNLSQNS